MGDIVSLVEKAAESMEADEAEKLARKLEKGKFDLNDMSQQLKQLTKMGGLSQLMNLLPGNQQMQQQMKNAKIDDKMVKRQLAIISSMTPKERAHPEVIKASRRQRIAQGSGTSVQEVNKLLKQFADASKMMKRVQKLGKKGLARAGMPGLGGPGGGMGGMGGGMPPGFGRRR
jgi:signal recognition particle subunit SRP54